MSKQYIIGTRGSLLATTQARWVKRQMESVSGDRFDLKIIETKGDRETRVPLWQMEGKDFFVKELDHALLSGEVDLTVHSYKDLGHIRSTGICLAAITERIYGEDILLIKQETVERLQELSSLVVGTSAPRRITHVTRSLASFLPTTLELPVECKVLRGNINTRLEKLHRGEYHAIILALAGPERLARDPSSREILQSLLGGLTYMILPSSLFPSAAAQGALAIEVRSQGSEDVQKKLAALHHLETAKVVEWEREFFRHYGGGCHLAMGIQVESVSGLFVHFERGEHDGREIGQKNLLGQGASISLPPPFFIGLPPEKNPFPDFFLSDELMVKKPLVVESKYPWQSSFVTSEYCLDGFEKTHRAGPIFASGVKTWHKLARRGYWVNASSDGLGHEKIHHYLGSHALSALHGKRDFSPLVTYSAREPERGEFIRAYQNLIVEEVDTSYRDKLERVQSFFWTSFGQYQSFRQKLPSLNWDGRKHFCGVGKTFQEFKKRDIEVTPFMDLEQFVEACREKIHEKK